MNRVLGRALLVLAATTFVVAAFWALRLAHADRLFRRQTAASVARASEVVPGNAAYHARLAELDDSRQQAELEQAVARNPYDAVSWMRLGLIAESEGDFAGAEQRLLESARVNRTFAPRWTLAGYYFRRGDEPSFWIWARKAAEMSYGDTSALYRLCWRVAGDPLEILDRAIPTEEDHLVRYLLFLMEEERLDPGVEVARRLIRVVSERHQPIVLGFCDRLIERRKTGQAVAVWNAIVQQGWLPHHELSPDSGHSLTNGDFATTPIGRAFDWRILSADGVAISAGAKQIGISFTGNQADRCELLLQYLPLAPNTAYRFTCTYTLAGNEEAPGLSWQMLDAGAGGALAPLHPLPGGRREAKRTLDFQTGDQTRLGRITLRYDRPSGAPRLAGSLTINEVTLQRTNAGEAKQSRNRRERSPYTHTP
ncbi:MAG: hypothetical protein GY953_35970 [bacterium]|nr:hypothetical protein [bacterium]